MIELRLLTAPFAEPFVAELLALAERDGRADRQLDELCRRAAQCLLSVRTAEHCVHVPGSAGLDVGDAECSDQRDRRQENSLVSHPAHGEDARE
jgi:hypothetical protein